MPPGDPDERETLLGLGDALDPEPDLGDVPAHAAWRRRRRDRALDDNRQTVETARRRERTADAAARAARRGAPGSQAAVGELSTFGEGHGRPHDIGALYGALIARAHERVELFSRQLAAAFAVEGDVALFRATYGTDEDGELFETGQVETALARMERQAAGDLERLIVTAMKLKIDAESDTAKQQYVERSAAAMREMARQLGLPPHSPETARLIQAAVIAARRAERPALPSE